MLSGIYVQYVAHEAVLMSKQENSGDLELIPATSDLWCPNSVGRPIQRAH
jgi:hypothetical protein